ncbi:MAG: hypothetical protein ACE5GC_09020, partial [Acidimicrobiia bacterium]
MPPDSIVRLVTSARRRLRTTHALRRLVAALGIVAAGGALVIGVGRVVVLPWAEPLTVAAAVTAAVAAVTGSFVRPPTMRTAAMEIDLRLEGMDRISTAWELAEHPERTAVEEAQVGNAAAWAEGRSLDRFGSVMPPPRLLLLVAFVVTAAVVLAVPASPADAEEEARRETAAVVEESALAIEALAAEVRDEQVRDELR